MSRHRTLFAAALAALGWGMIVNSAAAQEVIVYRSPLVVSSPQPVTTFYAPSTSVPVTTYYAPSGSETVTTYYAPASSEAVTTYYAPSTSVPVTTYYAPAPAVASQVTSYYAPAPATYGTPVTTYYAPTTTYYAPSTTYVPVGGPVVVAPRYVPGQPVRNFFRSLAP